MAALEHLQNSLEAAYDTSRRLIGLLDDDKRSRYTQALTVVGDGWRAFEAELEEAARHDYADRTATILSRIGDELFYSFGHADEAIATFELALSIAPRHAESLKGIIAAYLQGSARRPAHALPYAERLAAIDPGRQRDVVYIRSLLPGG